MTGILNAIQTSSQGLTVQRRKMNTVAENIANAETTRTKDGGPYRRKQLLVSQTEVEGTFDSMLSRAGIRLQQTDPSHLPSHSHPGTRKVDLPTVEAEQVTDPEADYRLIHEPTHPDADEDGYVRLPDIDVVTEMVDMMAASRAYEANTTAISSAKKMAKDALDI
jgi:flagellar basal-body rod protein FlgC